MPRGKPFLFKYCHVLQRGRKDLMQLINAPQLWSLLLLLLLLLLLGRQKNWHSGQLDKVARTNDSNSEMIGKWVGMVTLGKDSNSIRSWSYSGEKNLKFLSQMFAIVVGSKFSFGATFWLCQTTISANNLQPSCSFHCEHYNSFELL